MTRNTMSLIGIFQLLFLCNVTYFVVASDDPCKIAKILPNFELRLKVYKIDLRRGDKAMCDRYVINEPGEWFRTVDNNEMVNNKTHYFECGTQYSIYMQGNVPTIPNKVVNRTACVIPHCRTSYAIQVKKCRNFTAYYLPRPTSCDQAYCFGFGENGIAPNKTTNKPVVQYQLVKVRGRTVDDLSYQKLVFRCDFNSVIDGTNTIYYKVFWYINDHTSTIFASKAVPENLLNETYLQGETGLNSIKLNVEISCKVRLYYHPKGPPGPSSERSEKFFAGIQPLARTYDIMRDGSEALQFNFTVPFGCTYASQDDPEPLPCKHSITLTTPDYLKCSQGIYTVDMCGKEVDSRKWNETQIIHIKHKNDNNYRTIKTFEVHTQTKVRRDGEPFWDGVKLPTIYINVHEGPNKWKKSRCSAISDPHMTSFMQTHYESQEPGTYTLYRNMDDAGNINEVQMKVTPCFFYNGHMNQCACAIAARASSDIFVIDKCPETSPEFFGFKSCVEDILHVVKKTHDEHQYQIHFPSGTNVEVKFTWVVDPRSKTGKWTLNLHVNPSIADENRSQGLCGKVGTRKLLTPRAIESANHYNFSQSWKVADADNMLMMSTDMLHSFPKTKKLRDLCICDKKLKGEITDTFTCTNNETALIECDKEKDLTPVQKDICYERHSRRKRSTMHSFTYIPNNYRVQKLKRSKRSIFTPMTEPQARKWCENFMTNSPGFVACKNIPNVSTKRAVEVCILDIMTTNTTIFASAPRESVKAACLKEIGHNETLRNTSENGQNIAAKIQSITCPEECSGNGLCEKGKCKCNEGYGSGDCSININEPPPVYAVNYETGGLCDKLFCKEAAVEGDMFLHTPELTCKMQRFEINLNGTSWDLETSTVPGRHNTLSDIRCKFPHHLAKRSSSPSKAFVTGYRISVSNNNKNFSDAHAIYILDSTCQDTMNISGQLRFALKPGFCFIHGSCFTEGFKKRCYECDTTQNKFEWTFKESEAGCKDHESKPKLWIIGVVIAVLLLIVIIMLSVYFIKKKERVVHDISTIMPIPHFETAKIEKYKT